MNPDAGDACVHHGVDFSGSKNHRQKIWVATRAGDLPATTENGFSHAELVEAIAGSAADGRRHCWLIDAPLGLPLELLERHGVPADWRRSIEWLASFASPRDWRRACRKVSRREPRRPVDVRFKTPLSPVNIRMFKQTWHALVSVILPLGERRQVAVLPMDLAAAAAPDTLEMAAVRVGEGCPASLLENAGQSARGYKGSSDACHLRRCEIIEFLEQDQGIPLAPEATDRAVADDEGDALDSLLLLASARRFAACDHRQIIIDDARAAVEGWVYV